ncbi:HAMP domain-containing histidine kinase [Lactonifactor longoviformis]|uniref:HAMP domain-containing sensor histidine kinase n=1 Tax=Lactonifactor longoviformis TaxID=341220 RepID=UPI00210A4B42|nr:HAMP domain-containing sensor histidine kinase [Lactonifactor longoviformis]MCQ4669955.1 HAMP domain-containing histidine kinase [Lactonifactor longoviformis]
MGKVKEAFKNMPIRKSLMLLMGTMILLVVLLTVLTLSGLRALQGRLERGRGLLIQGYTLEIGETHGEVKVNPSEYEFEDLQGGKKLLYEAAGAGNIIFPVIYSIGGVAAAACLFYRRKLKEPMTLLSGGTQKIAENNLDFTVSYSSGDELGQLCQAFEGMRSALEENEKKMWRILEERKEVNASIAHDLRTPITIIQGAAEYLEKSAGKGELSFPKAEKYAVMIRTASERMESYVNSMRDLMCLEEVRLSPGKLQVQDWVKGMEKDLELLAERAGKSLKLIPPERDFCLFGDPTLMRRVIENLTANGLRFASREVTVTVTGAEEGQACAVKVEDDGPGFREQEAADACLPFYSREKEGEQGHVGMGLYVSKVLCQAHQGSLTLENRSEGGAAVTAVFCAVSHKLPAM